MVGFALLYCAENKRQPTIEAPSSDKQEHNTSRKGDSLLKRQIPPTTTAAPDNPQMAVQDDSKDIFSAALTRQRKKDYQGAIELFEKACGEGQSAACYELGVVYRDGIGVAVSDRRAQSWFQLACQKGSVAACDALGH